MEQDNAPPADGSPDFLDYWVKNIGEDWAVNPPEDTPLYEDQMQYLESEIIRNVEFGTLLGQGNYGRVYEVVADHRPNNGQWVRNQFACKVIRHKGPTNHHIQVSLTEMTILRNLKHKYICNMIESLGIPDTVTGFPYAVVVLFLEQCDGDLHKLFFDGKTLAGKTRRDMWAFDEPLSRHWFSQVARGLEYIHSNGVAHRSISLSNILFQYGNITENTFNAKFVSSTFKLADFGISKVGLSSSEEHQIALNNDIERLVNMLYETGIPGPDTFQASFMLKTKFMQKCLSSNWTRDDPWGWTTISTQMKDLMGRMADTNNIISAFEIAQHPWLEPDEEQQ